MTTAVEAFDLAATPLRALNHHLHDLAGTSGSRVLVTNPSGARRRLRHRRRVDGHVGYYCAGMNKHATIRVHGNAGTGVAENMMSGSFIVDGSASQSAGATAHGGLLVVARRRVARAAASR